MKQESRKIRKIEHHIIIFEPICSHHIAHVKAVMVFHRKDLNGVISVIVYELSLWDTILVNILRKLITYNLGR